MTTYVALLRAVNVAGANQIRMDRLRAAFTRAGYDDVATHIQSGNVILRTSLGSAAIGKHVESVIADEFGLTVTAVMRTARQLAAVCAGNPFLAAEADPSTLYVAYLSSEPAAASVDVFMAFVDRIDDEVQIVGDHAYIRFANGAGRTKLTTTVWKKLGVESTMRNWNVSNKLAELAATH